MKNIFIITNSIDLTVDYLINKYSSHEINFFRFNTDYFQDYKIIITAEGTIIEYKDQSSRINLSKCGSLYYRKISMPSLSEYAPRYIPLMHREMLTVIEGIAETTGKYAITRPSILRKADNKIVQMKLAGELGFRLPRSLITNSNISAMSFCSDDQTIVKPISFGKIIGEDTIGFIQTNLVDRETSFCDLDYSPAYFQSYISKDYEVRLTIVGDKLFGVRIDSTDKVDWRKESSILQYSTLRVPADISDKCIKMMKLLKLNFAAFDFIVHEGEYIFLELNANGQWLWLEEELNLKISDALIDNLLGKKT
ncbi:MvdC/MvdD family ATP grasp protein [Exiguobacterium alkaliphilum]|uniref:MvdD-like pre-ATP grasp domain-containing protein n=1 Tax=Exiguobacterium alkaliphilum TaxID=1428684 RepID=A0ABT2L0T4_9BACL|nr:hypothetical protein [Exiguobacterium alkaliphilum]MCT4795420.1 hypothetical protein [Exiguobacterium alkaliphilum]